MIILGIDPGASGGIAIWNGDKISKAIKCPKTPEEMSDIILHYKTKAWIDNHDIVSFIEHVHAFPTDARSAAFKFGVNYGLWQGVLGANKIKRILIAPQVWMKYWKQKLDIEMPKNKQERKRKLKEIAAERTDLKVTLYNADAILIALYGLDIERRVI